MYRYLCCIRYLHDLMMIDLEIQHETLHYIVSCIAPPPPNPCSLHVPVLPVHGFHDLEQSSKKTINLNLNNSYVLRENDIRSSLFGNYLNSLYFPYKNNKIRSEQHN